MHKFGLWAPRAEKMALKLGDRVLPMEGPNKRGWWSLEVDGAGYGDDYAFLIDDDPTLYPDPRSNAQTNGVHGMSRLYDHSTFEWHDQLWRGSPKTGAVFYEVHVGTFSQEGTFDGAIPHLDYLADLGITHVELMPVAEFAGERGWGYDGVALFATHEPYGGPDGLKRFVDACHARSLSVVLDLVFNHFGPVGSYADKFAPYLTDKHRTPWGEAVNLDEGGSDEVRRFFCDNALMWLRDYHCDGLRFDAVHEFYDRSAVHFIEQISAEVERLSATVGKEFFLIAESDLNDPRVVRPLEARGYGMDAQWSDDFHHSLFTILYTKEPGRGYYDDFGTMADLHKALQHAYVYDGRYSTYRKHKHGRPVEGLSAHHFIHFDQNHDQVGNRAMGERLEHLCGLDAAKVAIGIVLMAPYLPMLFMGEEFAASSPFLYFADHEDDEMRKRVADGRKRDFALFFGDEVPNPEDVETFKKSKLNWEEIGEGKHAEMLAWTKALIKLRRSTAALNDGDMHHLLVSTDGPRKTLTMQREEVRIVANFGEQMSSLYLLEGEEVRLVSRENVGAKGKAIELPGMTLAVLMSTTEQLEDREVP
ncbi:MAG: malto-oligosyltrehalose trehalohydrolase [Acidobacteriota bacterium]|nr:malto-oligosyltrehalose trehalohydrolase [Acidobacteriota bacterium]